MKRVLMERNRYYDSVFLMRISSELASLDGVRQAVVSMATPANLENLAEAGFSIPTDSPEPQDLLIALDAETEGAFAEAREQLDRLLRGVGDTEREGDPARPVSLEEALGTDPKLNLALISVPGQYATREARRSLEHGLHVMLFSDHVSIDDEKALKRLAQHRGRLMMGPDCGTAILHGTPLGFANVVRRGPIGLVGASGTGIQEVSSLIDRYGSGVSQAVGTGGRDLSDEIGGLSMLMGIDALAEDPATAVLVVISKAPGPKTEISVLERLARLDKPSIVHFVAADAPPAGGPVTFAATLEEAARLACIAVGVAVPEEAPQRTESLLPVIDSGRLSGFFCGGTLCQEAWAILDREGFDVLSNVAARAARTLEAGSLVDGHVLWDLGDDAFTVGRPHPMIEPSLRDDRIAEIGEDPAVAVVMADCVLGYGAHPHPAESLAEAVRCARDAAHNAGRSIAFVASVTGTDQDPQGYSRQRRVLEQEGVVVGTSNAEATRIVAALLTRMNDEEIA